jgi:hypothetical protein
VQLVSFRNLHGIVRGCISTMAPTTESNNASPDYTEAPSRRNSGIIMGGFDRIVSLDPYDEAQKYKM